MYSTCFITVNLPELISTTWNASMITLFHLPFYQMIAKALQVCNGSEQVRYIDSNWNALPLDIRLILP